MVKTFKVRKLFRGYVSLRDYQVERFLNDGFVIEHGGRRMTVPPRNSGVQLHGKEMKSKFGGTYKLIDFKWCPDET